MKNADTPARPLFNADLGLGGDDLGLTKREHFAAMAMQGLLVNVGRNGLEFDSITAEAARQADLLLKELEE